MKLSCLNHATPHFNVYYHCRSEEVVRVLGNGGLPAKGSAEYYSARAAFDLPRHPPTTKDLPAYTFAGGDVTKNIHRLGYLQYAHIYVGTPPVPFPVALDTGSDVFWLPCRCQNCSSYFMTSRGKIVNLNSYEPGSSSTSEVLLCNSSYCSEPCPLPAAPTPCPYEVNYMSENTLTRGFLVQDLVHLETYTSDNATRIHPPVVFGCGEVETGLFLGGGGLNGLLGLGHTPLDVTTLLSSQGLIRNSFSMCFAHNGNGRIAFGDKGDADQRVTPLVDARTSAQYNVRVDRIYVNDVVTKVGFKAMFDSGTSLTYLAGEAYAVVTQAFVSLVKDQQHIEFEHPFFEYCYIPGTSNNNASFGIPSLSFNTKGGANFSVISPMFSIKRPQQVYCMAIVNNKVNTLNIIGRNYLTGYRIIFDRERSILGWKPSNCISKEANTTASNGSVLSAMKSILFFFLVSFSFSNVMYFIKACMNRMQILNLIVHVFHHKSHFSSNKLRDFGSIWK